MTDSLAAIIRDLMHHAIEADLEAERARARADDSSTILRRAMELLTDAERAALILDIGSILEAVEMAPSSMARALRQSVGVAPVVPLRAVPRVEPAAVASNAPPVNPFRTTPATSTPIASTPATPAPSENTSDEPPAIFQNRPHRLGETIQRTDTPPPEAAAVGIGARVHAISDGRAGCFTVVAVDVDACVPPCIAVHVGTSGGPKAWLPWAPGLAQASDTWHTIEPKAEP